MSLARPRVSVVVPCYEHADYVLEALDSVAAQDLDEIELVVVDDASRDASAARVREWMEHPRVRERFGEHLRLEVSETNRGAHAALNRGAALARAPVLAVLNSDDAFAPGRLRTLLVALEAAGSELAFSGATLVDEHSREVAGGPEADALRRHQRFLGRWPSVGLACLAGNVALTSGNLVFTRGLLEATGGFLPLRYCHDWELLLRACLRAEPVYVPRPLYRYRLHSRNSFRALGRVAEEETREVIARYVGALRRGEATNPLVPSPEAWPGVFEELVRRRGLRTFWRAGEDAHEVAAW